MNMTMSRISNNQFKEQSDRPLYPSVISPMSKFGDGSQSQVPSRTQSKSPTSAFTGLQASRKSRAHSKKMQAIKKLKVEADLIIRNK